MLFFNIMLCHCNKMTRHSVFSVVFNECLLDFKKRLLPDSLKPDSQTSKLTILILTQPTERQVLYHWGS